MKHDFRHFCRYVFLQILGMLGLSCYILADTFFISLVGGSAGLAALSIALPAYSFIYGTGLMLGIGGSTLRIFFIEKKQPADHLLSALSLVGIGFGLLCSLCGILFVQPIARFLGADQSLLGITCEYLQIILLYAPAFILNQIVLAFVRSDRAPALSMVSMLVSSGLNILLDYVFMFPCGWGIRGAAIATGFAPISGLAVLSIYFFRPHTLSLRPCLPSLRDLGRSCHLGLPFLVSECASGIALFVFNRLAGSVSGEPGIAAYSIVANLALVATSVFTGVGQGAAPLISRTTAAGDQIGQKRLYRYAIVLCLTLSAVIYGTIWCYTHALVRLFNTQNDSALNPLAQTGLRLYFLGYFFAGLNIFLGAAYSAQGYARSGFLLSLMRGFLLLIPVALGLSLLGMNGIWLAFPVTECGAFLGAMALGSLQKRNALRK